MGIFYTGKGDRGKSYVGKIKIEKTSLGIEAIGELDELNSLIGLIKSQPRAGDLRKILHDVQESLFVIQTNVGSLAFSGKFKAPQFKKTKTAEIEKIIDDFEKEIKPARKFIIPGATSLSAWLDYARAFSRRVERDVLKFSKRAKISEEILTYLNRLSSLFFAMARIAAKRAGRKEKHPSYK